MASASILIGRNQNARFQKNLKAVAHAQDQFLGVAEFAKFIPQKVSELIRQDFPCRNIVTITEAAGNHEDLVAMQQFGIFAEAVDVDWFRFSARTLESKLGFAIAIGAGSAQDQHFWCSHDELLKKGGSSCLTSMYISIMILLYDP